MTKVQILAVGFFNTEILQRSMHSLAQEAANCRYPCELYLLENTSAKSPQIAEMAKKLYDQGSLTSHILSSHNVATNVVLHALRRKIIPCEAEYIAITEADVILDPGSMNEALDLLESHPSWGLCSIDIHLTNLPLEQYPDSVHWIPEALDRGDYLEGPTGFQFILFRKDFLVSFLESVLRGELRQPIALLNQSYVSMSDANLILYCSLSGIPWIRTKKNRLLHIGWELYSNPDNDYMRYKEELVRNGQIWADYPDTAFTTLLP